MPAYLSHAIMGEQVYNELMRREDIIKTPIIKEELKGYSLGADLSYLSKKVIHDPHNYNTQDFFIKMIEYIKRNNLSEDSSILSLLYGHISHYFFDVNAHPFIYYLEYGCKKNSIISNHNLIEGYLSAYLSKIILNKNIMDLKASYFNQIDLSNEKITKIINSIYGEVYGDYSIIKSCQKVVSTFTNIENITKNKIITESLLIKISNFKSFLERNNLTTNEIINDTNSIYLNPLTGEKQREQFIELYYRSIDMTLDAIKKVNEYLYSNYDTHHLEAIFTDLSYDTGRKCSLGRKLIYTRKR